MHTNFGVLAKFVSLTLVCITKVGQLPEYKDAAKFNIGLLDEVIRKFPIKHSLPFRMKRFNEGISPYCAGLGESNEKQGTGFGDLGIIDNKDVLSLVLQMILCKCIFKNNFFIFKNAFNFLNMQVSKFEKQYLTFLKTYFALVQIGIGTNNTIIPRDFEFPDLGNLNQCILTTGKLLLDGYLNASRSEIDSEDIFMMQEYVKCGNYQLNRLFCFKQRLCQSSKRSTGIIKTHGVVEQLLRVPSIGVPSSNDTSIYEHLHISKAKIPFTSSSRRKETLLPEMMDRIQHVR